MSRAVASDHPIGAIVRGNVLEMLSRHKWKTAYLVGGMGITASRFWAQFRLKRGPRLALVEKMAEVLGGPAYHLLMGPSRETDGPALLRSNLRTTPDEALAAMFPAATPDRRRGMTDTNFHIWRRLHLYAALLGKTELDICRQLGVERATWWSWWRKKSGIALDDLWRLAEALEVAPWEMLA